MAYENYAGEILVIRIAIVNDIVLSCISWQ